MALLADNASYDEKRAEIIRLIRSLPDSPGCPTSADELGMDVLRLGFPFFHQLLRNYGWREQSLRQRLMPRLSRQAAPGAHGSDAGMPSVEFKSATGSDKSLPLSQSMGTFDKTPSRMTAPVTLTSTALDQHLEAVFGVRDPDALQRSIVQASLPLAVGPLRVISERQRTDLLALVADPTRHVLPSLTFGPHPNPVAFQASTYTAFSLFHATSPDALMTFLVPSIHLEAVIGHKVAARYRNHQHQLTERQAGRQAGGPPTDHVTVTLQDLLDPRLCATLVDLNVEALTALQVTFPDELVAWLKVKRHVVADLSASVARFLDRLALSSPTPTRRRRRKA